ncbi:MAG: LAGLIDADG family homing endonuclease [archaeon]
MLEKLGQVLRKATDKIANAIFLDKNLVDSIIRDLQRALIEADVNILLVKELSDKIKKAALDERIKQIDKKEHIIKLLHDELISILGKYKPLKLEKTQNKILFLGLYGAGKCIHGKSNIQLSNGEIIKAKKLYKKYSQKFSEEIIEDGKIINLENENLLIPSYNPKTQKIEDKKATHLWKLKKDNLIEVKLDNGNDYSIKVTPEHPFFVLRNSKVIQVRADKISENDFISIPNKIEIQGEIINLFNQIKNLNLDIYLSQEEIKKHLPKEKTLKEICNNLKNKRNYCQFTLNIKKGRIPIKLLKINDYNFLKIKNQNSNKIITLPLFLNSDFAEFIGYVIGDGYVNEKYIEITTQDPEIINRIQTLSKLLFNINPKLKKDKRRKNLYQLQLISKTLVKIFKIFRLNPGKKGKNLEVPKQIMLSNNEIVKSFIKAYFDCDSYPSKNRRQIELTSESKIIIQQIDLLLRRFGILSTISKKIINKIPYWRLYIKAKYAETYSEKIGYLIKRKKDSVKKYKDIGILQGSGNQDMIPLGNSLKALRLMLGFSIGQIQENAVYSYGIYEQKGFISREQLKKLVLYYKLKKKGFFLNLLEDISNGIQTYDKYDYRIVNGAISHLKKEKLIQKNQNQINLSQKGNQQLQLIQKNNPQNLLNIFESLSHSNICWLPIKEINTIKNNEEFVYDLTVENNHSFIANGIIVHNTTTIAKLGNYFAKRGNKVALVGLDVHRPAAPEQLKQLANKNNLQVFILPKEKDPKKIWNNFKSELKNYNLILIDTAGRHMLDEELIKEIKELGSEIKPTQSILIMPADVGQAAKKQAKEFKDAVNISGVIITRMDSTAKGGGALTACKETNAPVHFIATGEKINDLEEFNPESFLSRLLGMGDLQALIEKIRLVTDEDKQLQIQKNLEEGQLSLEDVIEQVKSMNSMGGFNKIKGMIPGMSNAKIPENILESQQAKIAKWEHILKSMTPEERANPELLKKEHSRINRISKGSGVANSDIKSLLKQYDMLQEMVKSGPDMDLSKGLSPKQMQKLAKKFGKMKKIKFK